MSSRHIQDVKDLAKKVCKGLESLQDQIGDAKGSVRTLRTEFNLWTSVNGIFEDSVAERFASADDFSLLALMNRKMRCILTYLTPRAKGAPYQSDADRISGIRAAIKSLQRLGEAMRTEFPCHRLVKQIRGALDGLHDKADNLIRKADVVQEIKGLKLSLKEDEVEVYATRICKEYKLVFAILLLVFKPIRIFGFLNHGTSDDKLPIRETYLMEHCQKEGWMAYDASQFVYFQHLCINRLKEYRAIERSTSPASQDVPMTQLDKSPRMRTGFDTGDEKVREMSLSPLALGLPDVPRLSISAAPDRSDNHLEANWDYVSHRQPLRGLSSSSTNVVQSGRVLRRPTSTPDCWQLRRFCDQDDRLERVTLGIPSINSRAWELAISQWERLQHR